MISLQFVEVRGNSFLRATLACPKKLGAHYPKVSLQLTRDCDPPISMRIKTQNCPLPYLSQILEHIISIPTYSMWFTSSAHRMFYKPKRLLLFMNLFVQQLGDGCVVSHGMQDLAIGHISSILPYLLTKTPGASLESTPFAWTKS